MARRTGAKSVVSIGSSTVCDTGKGIQTLMELGMKTVDEFDRRFLTTVASKSGDSHTATANSSPAIVGNGSLFPHHSVATEVCPSYGYTAWSALHKSEDVLVRRPCLNPSVRDTIV
jgi:hypothetical protein